MCSCKPELPQQSTVLLTDENLNFPSPGHGILQLLGEHEGMASQPQLDSPELMTVILGGETHLVQNSFLDGLEAPPSGGQQSGSPPTVREATAWPTPLPASHMPPLSTWTCRESSGARPLPPLYAVWPLRVLEEGEMATLPPNKPAVTRADRSLPAFYQYN